MNKVKNPMKSIDLLDDIFRYEILELDCPYKKQVSLCRETNTIWFGDVDIFLDKLKRRFTRHSVQKSCYELVNIERLIKAVELKYK